MPQPSAQRGRPPRISRAEIVETARRIVDAEGVDRLTMRRLAKEIGSTPMALYHHVRDKEQLLVLLLDDYAARMARRPDLPADPRERVVAAAAAIRETLAACPWIAEVLTADDLMSRSALWFVEQILEGLEESGLSPERAVHAVGAEGAFVGADPRVRALRRQVAVAAFAIGSEREHGLLLSAGQRKRAPGRSREP